MRLGPFEISRRKATQDFITPWPITGPSAWWPVIRESFSGAWQRGVTVAVDDAATHPTQWACLTLIASDIAKCRPTLVEEDDTGICTEVRRNSPFLGVVDRPNHFQDAIQFYSSWMLSKLTYGNAYAMKARDGRGIVTELYVLNPMRVKPMVTPLGDIYYALQQDPLAGLTEASIIVPAREIIHDRFNCLYHPLVGLSAIYASGHAAMQGLIISGNTTRLFKNGVQIGGILTAPGVISVETAKRLEQGFQQNYGGPENAGKIMALGDGLKFDKTPVMSAVDAQLIDQLKWDDEKICATHHVPAYMANVGPLPSYNNVEALGQQYYGQCLQFHIESLEACLTYGLDLPAGMEIEFDLDALDRMDSVQRMEVATKGVIGGVLTPDEARARFNKGKTPGGDVVYLQKQNWPLELLGQDAKPATPPASSAPPALPAPVPPKSLDFAEIQALVAKELA
jgi:HK97 family phage portal protein